MDPRQPGGQPPPPSPPLSPPPVAGAALLTLIERTLSTGTAVHLPGPDFLRLTLPLFDGDPDDGSRDAPGDGSGNGSEDGATDGPSGAVPFTVDVIADPARAPRGVVYLLPGGGLNFTASFLTPGARNLAQDLRRRGFLVVGLTPREDAARPGDVTAEWGLAAHRRDLARVVDALDPVLRLPYQYAGHSAGAALALDAASHDPSPRLRRVVVLDTTGPLTGAGAVRAAATRDAYAAQLAAGTYASDAGLAGLVSRAVTDPGGPSPAPWPRDPALRFTNAGLAHYALIHTAELPGPANWIYARGHSAGTYAFGATPAEDRFTLTHTPLTLWHAATAALGSGLVPVALLRDLCAAWAGDGTGYSLAWDRIGAEVLWLTTEFGRGDHPRGADLIRASGNPRVTYRLIPGYGHADAVWSTTAAQDIWPLL
ncbi:hypothetical protein [Streptomyces sp. G-G2]|uniref:hypothetical protein n=1 Tax=Streptomyces sp. G-G2 TaxID=3046201 RepID=UPI0024B910A4|nr:hypothetical protein [Streptomyces sp. G-G2]MDJ0379758.1 hypothetical protein [Streptomyces sp. G-G2]